MKKLSKYILLVTLFVGYLAPAWGQVSTEGKEFWVALTLSAAPSSGTPEPFIAVSTKKKTTITITNPNDASWAGVTRTVEANTWEVFEMGNSANQIPLTQWYPTTANSIANILPQAGQTHNYGLKVVTDEEVSVFAALWMLNSFDAANILPAHILQTDYYTQDYPPYIKPSDGDALAMFTVLATQNNTKVNITPSTTTQDGKAAGTTYSVTLNAGQTYYVISKTLQTLSGTHVVSDKPVAVFQGDVFTQIPGGKAARDCTYEQAMPTDYWGTQFVVTRSKEKDANRIRFTAMTDGTDIFMGDKANGDKLYSLNAGQTFELELYKNLPTQADLQHPADVSIAEDALFIETSCPVAVYSYDVSNGYKSTPSEMYSDFGDPSMVWISPLEQRIKEITFGVCGTSKTSRHFVDIVCQTSDVESNSVTPNAAEAVTFLPVPNNSQWSYARVYLSTAAGKTGVGNRVFTLKNQGGVIAHVYGNGDDESYAYSVGSSAIKRGIEVNNSLVFTDDTIISDIAFCLGEELTFNANIGTDEIEYVNWNFGDGIVKQKGSTVMTHQYLTEGWYDVSAELIGARRCSGVAPTSLDTVNFSIYLSRPKVEDLRYDTVFVGDIFSYEFYGHQYLETIGDTIDTIRINDDCRRLAVLHLHVTCLQITVDKEANYICETNPPTISIPYTLGTGSQINDIKLEVNNGTKVNYYTATRDAQNILVKNTDLAPGKYNAVLHVYPDCDMKPEPTFPIEFTVHYPDSIFKMKFNNILVVYNKGYGGNVDPGWDFTGYQWYRCSDGITCDAIPYATESAYYLPTGETFVVGESYYVALQREGEMDYIPSCMQEVTEVKDYSPSSSNKTSARKEVINNQMFIIRDGKTYNAYGQLVQ